MGKIIPIILALTGLGAGTGAGFYLRPHTGAADEHATAAESAHGEAAAEGEDHAGAPAEEASAGHGEGETGPEYVKMSNQFIVPVVEDGRVASMVVLSLSLEVASGSSEAVFAREPKLRDSFLQILFDHANAGGFRGSFTDGANLIVLRRSLMEAAQKTMGDKITDVLIADIARQDS
jgi:flagellar protein FliL